MPRGSFNTFGNHKKRPPDGQLDLFLAAAAGNDLITARQLLDDGAPLNGRDHNGWTALHHAASTGAKAMVIFLLNRKARPGLVNNDGHRADDVAWQHKFYEIKEIIKEARRARKRRAA